MLANTQSRDITKAIAALEALKAKTRPEQVRTLAHQVDSYEQHKDVAKEAAQVAVDLMTDICASAASLGNDDDTAAIRDTFRAMILDAVDEVFISADQWVDDVREEFGLEAA